MKLQTKIPIQKQSNHLIDYNSKVLLLGSCFVENIGHQLAYYKFQNLINPFGILFQPKAVEALITHAIKEKEFREDDIFFHNEQWHSFDAHSMLSHSSKTQLLFELNKNSGALKQYIEDASHVIITLGTAWVYRFMATNTFVANCHKVPQKQFSKELLGINDVFSTLKNMVNLIKEMNSEASIIFTISPVRHLKDGFVENVQSKSHLISALHQLLNQSGPEIKGLHYFPSYEIMMDELRDYRFYKEDLVHPNNLAVQYIWNRFREVWVSSEADEVMEAVEDIQKGLQHKPFNPNSEAHKKFLQNLDAKKTRVKRQYSHILF